MNTTRGTDTFDVAIIGGGSAGYAAARTAAAAGLRTVIIEGATRMGGLCILRGCMPSKAMLHAAEIRHNARHALRCGIRIPGSTVDLRALQAWKDAMIDGFARYRQEQLSSGRFQLVRAMARFDDPQTLALDHGERLRARHFIIACGSISAPAPLPELAQTGYWTSDDVLAMDHIPASTLVLGGGPIALEMAQLLARLGSSVTVIQRSSQVLRDFDEDAAQALEQALVEEGIQCFTGTHLLGAGRTSTGKFVTFTHQDITQRLEAEEIVLALGRVPHLTPLDLSRAQITTQQGRILVTPQGQTTQPHIYAAGDCASPHAIVHLAVLQGEIAAHNIAHPNRPRQLDDRLLLQVVFTDPQVAAVGLTEKEARRRGRSYLSATYPFHDHGKSIILGTRHGLVKLLACPNTGEILGGQCTGPSGGELIHEIAVAMAARMTVHQFAATPHYHPTLAEIWTYPAEELSDRIPLRQTN